MAALDAIDWPFLIAQARAARSAHDRVWVAATASGEEAYTQALAPHGSLLLGAADRLCCSVSELLQLDQRRAEQSPPRPHLPAATPALRRPLGHETRDARPSLRPGSRRS